MRALALSLFACTVVVVAGTLAPAEFDKRRAHDVLMADYELAKRVVVLKFERQATAEEIRDAVRGYEL